MKFNIQKLLKGVAPLLTVFCLILCLALPARAANAGGDKITATWSTADNCYYTDVPISEGRYWVVWNWGPEGRNGCLNLGYIDIVYSMLESVYVFYDLVSVDFMGEQPVLDFYIYSFDRSLVAMLGDGSPIGFDGMYLEFYPVETEPIDWLDYAESIIVDGSHDIVTLRFPTDWMYIYAESVSMGYGYVSDYTNNVTISFDSTGAEDGPPDDISIEIFPLGQYFSGSMDYYGRYLEDLPSGSTFTFDFSFRNTTEGNDYPALAFVQMKNVSFNDDKITTRLDNSVNGLHDGQGNYTFTASADVDTSAEGFVPALRVYVTNPGEQVYSFTMNNFSITMSISALYREYEQSAKNQELLEEVKKQLEEQNVLLEELLNGSQVDQEVVDKIEDAGAGLGDDIEDIQDFEDQYFAEFENNLDDIIAGADLNFLVLPLGFVQKYLDKIVSGVPNEYLVVFTLPILFGIFLYIVGHPVRAPRPDTSGDTVTRETFTTTTVLEGKHAGQSTTTRTVTTSQEIGRVHNE